MNHSGLVDLVQITNPEDIGSGLPPSTSEDAGKVLKVNSEGVPGWGEDAMATVDQTYDDTSTHAQSGIAVAQAISNIPSVTVDQTYGASSTNAQSGVAVAEAISGVKQVPSVGSSDNNKVLKATYSGGTGSYSWEDAPATVTVDQTYNASSTNPQSGTAVAGAIATVNQVPASTSSDVNKVLKVNAQGTPEWGTDSTVAVDQTYSASSTNAQSGVAVAEAIAAIPAPSVDEVPTVESTDDGKVLTASYSGGVGSYSWETAQGGGASYTASAPIAIESDDIKLKYNGDFGTVLPFDTATTTPESTYQWAVQTQINLQNVGSLANTKLCVIVDNLAGSDLIINAAGSTGWTVIAYKPSDAANIYMYANESYEYVKTSGSYNYIAGTNSGQSRFSKQYYTFTFPSGAPGSAITGNLCFAIVPKQSDGLTGTSPWNTPYADAYMFSYQGYLTTQANNVYNVPTGSGDVSDISVLGLSSAQKLPSHTSYDRDKVLTVNSSGNVEWATPSVVPSDLPTVDRTYSAVSTNAQSGVAVAEAIDGAVDVDTDNVVLTGDGDSIKVEFTRKTRSSSETQAADAVANASTTYRNAIYFDLDAFDSSVGSGFEPKFQVKQTIWLDSYAFAWIGFTDTIPGSSPSTTGFIKLGNGDSNIKITAQTVDLLTSFPTIATQRPGRYFALIIEGTRFNEAAVAANPGNYAALTGWPKSVTVTEEYTDIPNIVQVNALPANPDANTLYLIPET